MIVSSSTCYRCLSFIISIYCWRHVASEMGFTKPKLDSVRFINRMNFATESGFGFTMYVNPDSLIKYPLTADSTLPTVACSITPFPESNSYISNHYTSEVKTETGSNFGRILAEDKFLGFSRFSDPLLWPTQNQYSGPRLNIWHLIFGTPTYIKLSSFMWHNS